MSAWADLKQLRIEGRAPALKLFVMHGAHGPLRETLRQIGAMLIEHDPAKPIEALLLADLDVVLMLKSCKAAQAFAAAVDACEVKPAQLRAWCACSKTLSAICDAGCPL